MEESKPTPPSNHDIPKIPRYRSHFLPEASVPSPEPVSDNKTANLEEQNPNSPKKRLLLSLSEKEKLLNWELSTPGKFSASCGATSRTKQPDSTSQEPQKQQPEVRPGPSRPPPEPTPPLFGFQNWANSFRKSFSNKGNNPVVRRNRPLKARPMSEGSFNLGSMLSMQSQDEEPKNAGESQSRARSGSELTTLLEQVALSAKMPKGTKDDMASLPPRKLNFFSSLRIKRNEGANQSKGDDQKDMMTILSRFRSKG